MVGLRGPSVLGLAANQWRLEHAPAYHHSMKVALAKDLLKNSENVCYDLVKVSN